MSELIGIALAGVAGYFAAQLAAPVIGSAASSSSAKRATEQLVEYNRWKAERERQERTHEG